MLSTDLDDTLVGSKEYLAKFNEVWLGTLAGGDTLGALALLSIMPPSPLFLCSDLCDSSEIARLPLFLWVWGLQGWAASSSTTLAGRSTTL